MPYSLWSRGRLFGHSDLAYAQSAPWMRAGDFEPSELGLRLMPVILGVGPALSALHDVAERVWEAERKPGQTERPDGWPASVVHSSEFADAVSLQDEVESLALELRDQAGNVVPTESIWLQDTQRLIARAREPLEVDELGSEALEMEGLEYLDVECDSSGDLDGLADDFDELELELDDDLDAWEPEPSRYQILVALAGADRAMRRCSRPDG